jgi:hypothetical protein
MLIIGDRNTVVIGDIAHEIARLKGLLGALRRLAAEERYAWFQGRLEPCKGIVARSTEPHFPRV